MSNSMSRPLRHRQLRPARAACRRSCRAPRPIRAAHRNRAAARTRAWCGNGSGRRRSRCRGAAAWSPRPTARDPDRSRADCAQSSTCRRRTARTAPASGRAALMASDGVLGAHALLQILNLLAELVDHGLQLQPDGRDRRGIRLGAERIRFAVEFLRQEIELAADRRRRRRAASRAAATCAFSRSISSRMSALVASSAASWCSRASSSAGAASSSSRTCSASRWRISAGSRDGSASALQRQRLDGVDLAATAAHAAPRLRPGAPATSAGERRLEAARITASSAARCSSVSTASGMSTTPRSDSSPSALAGAAPILLRPAAWRVRRRRAGTPR